MSKGRIRPRQCLDTFPLSRTTLIGVFLPITGRVPTFSPRAQTKLGYLHTGCHRGSKQVPPRLLMEQDLVPTFDTLGRTSRRLQ